MLREFVHLFVRFCVQSVESEPSVASLSLEDGSDDVVMVGDSRDKDKQAASPKDEKKPGPSPAKPQGKPVSFSAGFARADLCCRRRVEQRKRLASTRKTVSRSAFCRVAY